MSLNLPPNSDDVARLFREHDDIGNDSSLFLRPLRQLFIDGKPISQVLALTVSSIDRQKLPLGMLTQTKKDRLIFWPILPSGVNMVCADEPIDVFDHITLEFPSERIHVTAYDSNGQPVHATRAWRTHHFPENKLRLWFILLLRISILHQQDMAVQRKIRMPVTDKERRTKEFIDYTQHLRFLNISLPHRDVESDYIYLSLYLVSNSITAQVPSPSIFPTDISIASQIEDWPVGNEFKVSPSIFNFDKHTICAATACPPGRLRSDVSVGFPQRR